MPRVLHLYKDVFPPVYGGIEVVLSKLAQRQAERGLDVTVAVSGPVDLEWGKEHGIKVIQVGELGRVLSNPISPGFLRVLANEPYDLLHLHLPCPTAVVAALLRGDRNVPWFASYQSDIVRQKLTRLLYGPFQQRFLSRCQAIFVSSENLQRTSPVLRRHEERCRLAPLGIPEEDPNKDHLAEAAKIRVEFGEGPLVLFVGRFRWYKGLHVLVEAMDRVDGTLLIVGSGEREESIRGQVANMRNPDRVRFLGTVERLEPLLHAADAFCLPSTHRAEAFGYVLLEAFRAGLPAVTTELGTGTSSVNLDGVTGYVVPPSEPGALADALNKILTDPDHRKELGEAARERVVEEFGLENMVDRIMDGYSEALPG